MPARSSSVSQAMTEEPTGFALYHWAPTSRRGQINRFGLLPGSLSSDRLWRPPFICLADGPLAAWNLIGRFRPTIPEWDLWWTTSTAAGDFEGIPHDDGTFREYRVYHRIYKRDLWHVGTRLNEHHTRLTKRGLIGEEST